MRVQDPWWNIAAWFTPAQWQAIWAFCTLIVAIVAAVLALRQLRQNAQAQREQSRPYVVVDFSAPHGGPAIFVEIRNSGLTAAHEIQLEWSDQPTVSDPAAAQAMSQFVFNGTIPFLAPGRSIRYFLGPFPEDEHREFHVNARYNGPQRHAWNSESVLSFDQWGPAEVDREPLAEIASRTRDLADTARKMHRLQERSSAHFEAIADYFRATPEYARSTAARRIQNYQRRRVVERSLHRRLGS